MTQENGQTLPDIRGFLPSSLNEWRGRIAALIFAGGCNLRCPFCHGVELVTDWRDMRAFSWEEIEKSLAKNAGWIDGVVVTGGEPTLQPGLENLIDRLRGLGLQVKLHSNGTRPDVLRKLLADHKLDCLALDCKARFEAESLRRACGTEVDVKALRQSFALCGEFGIECEFHTTLCPACVKLEDLTELARDLAKLAPQGLWLWQQYNPGVTLNPAAAGKKTYGMADIEAALEKVKPVFPKVELTGFH